eukprot:TRINITY_DN14317_c0_g1_i1.p1 TRINITY_DN14317_c0_g1~~TRINITY_DN14317_c0_g1_i1.p1  ORF type:complete len:116 (+),score=20.52 TRINITY_DN14317_c0_g1_i1:156-503(+)
MCIRDRSTWEPVFEYMKSEPSLTSKIILNEIYDFWSGYISQMAIYFEKFEEGQYFSLEDWLTYLIKQVKEGETEQLIQVLDIVSNRSLNIISQIRHNSFFIQIPNNNVQNLIKSQ